MSGTVITAKFTPAPRPAPGRKTKAPQKPRRKADPARVARMLALAHFIERQVESGVVEDYAAAAGALGVTRARLSQIASLLLLLLTATRFRSDLAFVAAVSGSVPAG